MNFYSCTVGVFFSLFSLKYETLIYSSDFFHSRSNNTELEKRGQKSKNVSKMVLHRYKLKPNLDSNKKSKKNQKIAKKI